MMRRAPAAAFGILAFTFVAALAGTRCGVEQPGVTDDYQKPRIVHAAFTQACAECHEKNRSPRETHPRSGDCGACHRPRDDRGGWVPSIVGGTGAETTGTGTAGGGTDAGTDSGGSAGTGGDTGSGTFSHEPPPTTCISCHAGDRPPPPHISAGDCVSCHKFPKWK